MSCQKVLFVLSITAFCTIMYMSTLEDDLGELYCGMREERSDQDIVGSEPYYWPWQVSIMSRLNQSDQYQHFCGGAIISQLWILTAAACVNFNNYTLQNNMVVLAGARHIQDIQEDRQFSQIESVILQKGYDPDSNSNNIALVKLRQPLVFTDVVSNICLPCRIRTKNKRIGKCHVTGYQGSDGGGMGLLMEEQIEGVSHKECNEWFHYTVTPDKLCARRADSLGCMGPIGGPLSCFVPAEERYFILGIRIYSRNCGYPEKPDVYLDVTRFYYWVKYYTGVA